MLRLERAVHDSGNAKRNNTNVASVMVAQICHNGSMLVTDRARHLNICSALDFKVPGSVDYDVCVKILYATGKWSRSHIQKKVLALGDVLHEPRLFFSSHIHSNYIQ